MQKPCASANLPRRIGVEEHLINFKSSPNFKNMKKFIKSKIDHTEISNRAQAAATSVAEKKAELPAPNIQPPLPLVPPPPDTPWTPVTVKQEIEDQEYKDSYSYEPKPLETQEQEDIKPRVVICRDYIRGTCKRIGTCKYAHKYDLSQLIGVYTFCRDFQTKRCTHANCKYVHADVFEEQNFYRTGYLPPHAFAHHKKPLDITCTTATNSVTMSTAIQPPPPPPPPPPEEPQPLPPPDFAFSKPPPPLPTEQDQLIKDYNALRGLEPSYLDLLQSNPLKRSWNALDTVSLLDPDLCSYPKKCKHCDIMEFCLQHSRNKLQKMIVNSEAMNVKIEQIDKKNAKLDAIIMKVLRSSQSSYLSRPFNMPYTRDMSQLGQLASLWNL